MLPNACKEPILGMYYLATLPGRRQAASRRAAEKRAPITTLFYHRVADDHPNDWTIGFERFQAHIEWIRERFEIITLTEAQHRIGSEENRTPAVCITFDDGYADNSREALPWLLDEKVPFTYFVSTDHIAEGKPFAHDEEAGVPLAPNSIEELRVLADAGVEIGAHTRSHADCGKIDDEEQLYEEIVGSKRDLEAMINRPVRYFAFPYGLHENLSKAAFRIAFQAGFWGICSAYGGYNFPGDDSFHLQRIHGDPSWARFCNWLTVDPRKLKRVERFDAGDYRLCF